ncbi:MAG TPA: DinB family protein [Longimicrobiaceae bacterium]|nr:DinB family protein [Longimicrobiaceae bacterium]
MGGVLTTVLDLLRSAALYTCAAGGVTAFLESFGRALCLPPFWPAEYVLRCRPGGVLPVLLRATLEAGITSLLLAPPALLVGAGVHLLVRGAERTPLRRAAPLLGALAGALPWVWIVRRLEPGYLDFIVGWWATGAGALAGAAVGGLVVPRCRNECASPPRVGAVGTISHPPMPMDDPLRAHLARLLDWQDAHVSFDAAVAGIPPSLRGTRPEGLPYSPWELLEHLRITQRDILDFCRDPGYVEPRWPDDYWPPSAEPPSPGAWEESVAAFRADREAMKRLAADPACDLFATIPRGTGQTYLREVLLVADHNAYHVGQMVAIRKLLGTWK